ncbi:MAG: S-layer homology domain-containing protein, partial [Clostridia bacterium]|nr:S-layer homology domain-containing protein [Clostridia bacterium]
MKKVLCLVMLLAMLVSMVPTMTQAATVDFADLNGHWARNYVLPLAQDGIISGKVPGVFDPDAQITRAEFITLVSKLTNLHPEESAPYADVAANAWFATTVSAAKAYGAIDQNLTADGNFYPDKPISREEMTSVIVRLAEEIRGALLNKKEGFTDAATFASWTNEYIAKAAGEGIVTGNPDGSFNAKGNATRAEAAVIIKRFRDLLKKPVRKLAAGEIHPAYDAPIFEVDLQKMIEDAYNAGQKTLTLEKGAYRISAVENIHLNLANMKDFTLDGNGSTLLCQTPSGRGLYVDGCENVIVKNLNIDYEPLTMWQARVTAVKPDDLCLEIEIPLGYRIYEEDRRGFSDEIHTQVYKPDGTSHYGVPSNQVNNFSKLEKIGDRKYRLKNARMTQLGIEVGDILAGGNRNSTKACVTITDSKECQFINMGAWGGSVGLGISGGYGAHRFDNFRVEPGPRPLGAIEDRVMSSVADAAHINYMHIGPTIENSRFAGAGDDGFNCYGAFSRVAERKSDTEYVVALSSNASKYFFEQDVLRIYTPEGSYLGTGKIEKLTKLEGYTPKVNLREDMGVSEFQANGGYVNVKL